MIFNYGIKMTASKNLLLNNDATKIIDHRGFDYIGMVKNPLMMMPLLYTASIAFFYPDSAPLRFLSIGNILCVICSLYFLVKFVQNQVALQGVDVTFKATIFHYIGAYDPNNPNVLVDKKVGIGSTVNFATRGGKLFLWVCIILPFTILIGMAVFMILR